MDNKNANFICTKIRLFIEIHNDIHKKNTFTAQQKPELVYKRKM